MKNKFEVFALAVLTLLISSKLYSQQAWTQLYYGPDYQNNMVQFVDANTGWIACSGLGVSPMSGAILKSTDGGAYWLVYMNGSMAFTNLNFINTLTGWAVGNESIISPQGNIKKSILKSTNGGITFLPQYSETGNDGFMSIKFYNESTGYAVSKKNVYKSTDGGNTWVNSNPFDQADYKNIFVPSPSRAYIVSSYNFYSYTYNGGETWLQVVDDWSTYYNSMFFLNELTGWIGAKNGLLKRTNDGGLSWVEMHNYLSNKGLFFVSPTYGFVINDYNTVGRTTNGGANWANQSLSYPGIRFSSIFFINSQTGWIVGSGLSSTGESVSLRLKTTTGGVTGVNSGSTVMPDNFSLSQNYPNPFNPTTVVNYQLPVLSYATLKIYNSLGNEVKTLVNEQQNAGSYSVDFNAAELPSGIYFYTLVTENFSETKKMILVK